MEVTISGAPRPIGDTELVINLKAGSRAVLRSILIFLSKSMSKFWAFAKLHVSTTKISLNLLYPENLKRIELYIDNYLNKVKTIGIHHKVYSTSYISLLYSLFHLKNHPRLQHILCTPVQLTSSF